LLVLDDKAAPEDFFTRMKRNFVWVKIKVQVYLAAQKVCLRCLDAALDLRTAVKFGRDGHLWWAATAALFMLLSPVVQFIFMARAHGRQTAWPYLLPLGVKHICLEIQYVRFLAMLPQSAFEDGLLDGIGAGSLNKVLAGIECGFENFPQAVIQISILCVKSGDWLNVASIALSLLSVAHGVYTAVNSLLTKKAASKLFSFEDDRALGYSSGKAASFVGKNLTEHATQEALLWFLLKDELITQVDISKATFTDKFVPELAHICTKLEHLYLTDTMVTDEAIKELAHCKNLSLLYIACTKVTDATIKELAHNCKNLSVLNLGFNEVTDVAVEGLAHNCKTLQVLYLRGTLVTDAGIKELAQNLKRNFRRIYLRDTQVTDAAVNELAFHCKDLHSLYLYGTKVTDVALLKLAETCKDLDSLCLRDTKVTDAGVKELARNCKNLGRAYLGGTQVTDVAVRELAHNCENLTLLELNNTQVTDVAIKEVAHNCKSLIELEFCGTQVTDGAAEEVRKMLPSGCKVSHGHSLP